MQVDDNIGAIADRYLPLDPCSTIYTRNPGQRLLYTSRFQSNSNAHQTIQNDRHIYIRRTQTTHSKFRQKELLGNPTEQNSRQFFISESCNFMLSFLERINLVKKTLSTLLRRNNWATTFHFLASLPTAYRAYNNLTKYESVWLLNRALYPELTYNMVGAGLATQQSTHHGAD